MTRVRRAELVAALRAGVARSPQRHILVEQIEHSLHVLGGLDESLRPPMTRPGRPTRQTLAVIRTRQREVALLVRMLEVLGLDGRAPDAPSLMEYLQGTYPLRPNGAEAAEERRR